MRLLGALLFLLLRKLLRFLLRPLLLLLIRLLALLVLALTVIALVLLLHALLIRRAAARVAIRELLTLRLRAAIAVTPNAAGASFCVAALCGTFAGRNWAGARWMESRV